MLIDNAQIVRSALRGKVAVVTGSGRGIGRETARVLAHLGSAVIIAEIDETGRDAQRQIRAEGGQALFVQADIADPAAWARLQQQMLSAFGPAHILINNAEAFKAAPLLEHSLDDWERIFAVNLRGAFLGIQTVLPEMLRQKDGVIVTMRSADGMPYLSAYLASKVGLRSLALSLAAEVGAESGVSVYCCGPGMVDTPGIRAAVPQLAPLYGLTPDEFIRQSAPGGELMSAEAAATGLVGTVLHAAQFHGQDIDSFIGLQQLGLTVTGERWQADEGTPAPVSAAVAALEVGSDLEAGIDGHARSALRLNRALEDMLRTNIREYDELSMFQRPIVKRMFQQGTGLKVDEWLASAQDMTRRLERPSAPVERARLEAYCAQLRRLQAFLVKQESDARGFFKEPAKLKAALDGLKERQAIVNQLMAALSEDN